MNSLETAAPPHEVAVQLPEAKMSAAELQNGTLKGVSGRPDPKTILRRKADVMNLMLRLSCVMASATALTFMVTAHQGGTISAYGFNLPVYSKWSLSFSFEYLVGVSAAVAAHSLLQLLISLSRLLIKSPLIPSRTHAWLLFAADQVFAYFMLSAGAAASGVNNLNRTGIQHTALPNFCKPLSKFCDHVAVSIIFTFFGCFLVALSAVQDVIWLSKY